MDIAFGRYGQWVDDMAIPIWFLADMHVIHRPYAARVAALVRDVFVWVNYGGDSPHFKRRHFAPCILYLPCVQHRSVAVVSSCTRYQLVPSHQSQLVPIWTSWVRVDCGYQFTWVRANVVRVDSDQRCVDMYPRIDILQISVILTDTDSNFLAWTDTDTLSRIFYGHELRLHFIWCFKFYFILFSIVNIRHRQALWIASYRVIKASTGKVSEGGGLAYYPPNAGSWTIFFKIKLETHMHHLEGNASLAGCLFTAQCHRVLRLELALGLV